jgi:hypothetical protein
MSAVKRPGQISFSQILGLFILLLFSLYSVAAEHSKKPHPAPKPKLTAGNQVSIITDKDPLQIPPEFQEQLKQRGFNRLVFVDNEFKLHVFEHEGTPADLCHLGQKSGLIDHPSNQSECTLDTNALSLVRFIHANGNCGSCSKSGILRACVKTGQGEDKYYCNRPHQGRCVDNCQ